MSEEIKVGDWVSVGRVKGEVVAVYNLEVAIKTEHRGLLVYNIKQLDGIVSKPKKKVIYKEFLVKSRSPHTRAFIVTDLYRNEEEFHKEWPVDMYTIVKVLREIEVEEDWDAF